MTHYGMKAETGYITADGNGSLMKKRPPVREYFAIPFILLAIIPLSIARWIIGHDIDLVSDR